MGFILDTLGVTAGMHRSEVFNPAKEGMVSTASTKIEPNVDKLGLGGLSVNYKTKTITKSSNPYLSDAIGNLKNGNKLKLRTYPNGGKELIAATKHRDYSLGMMADENGRIYHASSLSKYSVASKRFLSEEATNAIAHDKMGEANILNFIDNNSINYNAAKIDAFNKAIESGKGISGAQKAAREFESKYIRRVRNTSDTLESLVTESVVPVGLNSKNSIGYIRNYEAMVNDLDFSSSVNPTILHSASDVSKGILNYPIADIKINPEYNKYLHGGLSEKANMAFRQAVTKEVLGRDGRTVERQTRMFINHESPVVKAVFLSGVGNKGIPMTPPTDESLYRDILNVDANGITKTTLRMSTEGSEAAVSEGSVDFIDGLLNYYTRMGDKTVATLPSNNARAYYLKKMVNSGDVDKVLSGYAKEQNMENGLLLNRIFKGNKSFVDTATGKVFVPGGDKIFLNNIGLGKDGLEFEISKFGGIGKAWGTNKSVTSGAMLNIGDMGYNTYAFASMAEDYGFSEDYISNMLMKHSAGGNTEADFFVKTVQNEFMGNRGYFDRGMEMSSYEPRGGEGPINSIAQEDTRLLSGIFPKDMRHHVTTDTDRVFGIRSDIVSHGSPAGDSGYLLGKKGSVNVSLTDRLYATQQKTAADHVASKFDSESLSSFMQEYSVWHSKRPEKDFVGIEYDTLSEPQLKRLLSPNMEEARAEAQAISEGLLNIENVSAKTRYYIKMAGDTSEIRIPLPMFDSKWTGEVSHGGLTQTKGPIRSQISSITNSFVKRASGASGVDKQAMYREYQNSISGILLNPKNFTNVLDSDVSSAMLHESNILDPETIWAYQRKMEHSKFAEISKKWGLDIDSENLGLRKVMGVSKNRMKAMLKDTELKKELLNDYGTTSDLHAAATREGFSAIVGRPPYYSLEGVTTAKVIDAESMLYDFALAANGDEKVAEKMASANIPDYAVPVSEDLKHMSSGDNDNDPLSIIRFKEKKKMLRANAEAEAFDPIVRHTYLYNKKGGIKSFSMGAEGDIAESSNVQSEYIGRIFNKSRAYSIAHNKELLSAVSDGEISAADKIFAWEHFIDTLPETAIGAKGLSTKSAAEKVLSLFQNGTENREEIFRDIIGQQNKDGAWNLSGLTGDMEKHNGKNIMDLLSNEDVASILNSGDKYAASHQTELAVANTGKKTFSLMKRLVQLTSNKGATETEGNVVSELYQSSVERNRSGARNAYETFFDVAGNVGTKAIKNKKLWMLAGAVTTAALLSNSRHDPVEEQAVREQSRPKEKKNPAEPIYPPTALMSPGNRVPRSNIRITGNVPNNMSHNSILSGLSNMGHNVKTMVINRSNRIDEQYLNNIRDEKKLNSWSL